MAAVYLFGVRLIDFNEKEPLWAVLLLFGCGLASAVVLLVGINLSELGFIELDPLAGALAFEMFRFGGVGAGVALLTAATRKRGYSEINGLMDGVVYGSAAGLGFATGLAITREVLIPVETTAMAAPSLAGYGTLALTGVSDGVFGALMGIGFALAIESRKPAMRFAGPLGGLAAAIVAHLAYDFIAEGDPFGDAAVVRKWVGLVLPLLVVAVVAIIALRSENKAIAEELEAEVETGAVTPDELKTLRSMIARELMYLKRLLKFDFSGWSALHSLHNRQVQLALAKRRVAEETDEAMRAASAGEVAHLRVAVFDLKKSLGMEAPDAPGGQA
jgi:hypothetical protein